MEIDDPLRPTPSYVLAAAAEIELAIAPEYLAAVELDLARARAIARFLIEFPLDQGLQIAPIFHP